MALFLAGPLAAPAVLEALGVREAAPARLPGYALTGGGPAGLPLWTAGEAVPGLVASVDPLSLAPLAAALGAELRSVRLADGREVPALVGPHAQGAAAPWDETGWRARFAGTFAAALPALFTEGRAARPRIAMILSQAAARLRARAEPHVDWAAGPSSDTVALRRATTGYRGFFALDVCDLDYPHFAAAPDGPVRREVLRGTDATLVLPYDPAADAVLLVEQFRPGAWARGDAWPWTLEPVAGLVDAGETPVEAAAREAQEEAGIALEKVIEVSCGYPSPGITSEFYHLFVGICDLSSPGGGGLAHEGEDIRVHVLPWPDFDAFLETAGARVLPLYALGLWLRLNRARLRQPG